MALRQTIVHRRSVRTFTPEPIPDHKLEAIIEAGLLAPTSQNRKPCEFYVIRNKGVLQALSKAKQAGGGFLADCDAAIAVLGNGKRADTWVEDCSIAMSYMNLMAAEQGIGSCWCQIHLRSSESGVDAEETVRAILSVPEEYRIVGILGLGIPAKEPPAHTAEDADFSKVHRIL